MAWPALHLYLRLIGVEARCSLKLYSPDHPGRDDDPHIEDTLPRPYPCAGTGHYDGKPQEVHINI